MVCQGRQTRFIFLAVLTLASCMTGLAQQERTLALQSAHAGNMLNELRDRANKVLFAGDAIGDLIKELKAVRGEGS